MGKETDIAKLAVSFVGDEGGCKDFRCFKPSFVYGHVATRLFT